MTATIPYDLPVKNLIDELSATGHVTHTSYAKTGVTFHHNGGRLSHEGCLRVWTYRAASAHFDVDKYGDVAQYVKALEYAWSCANTTGNQRTISIEMCNETLGPDWLVSETTWKSAARLAGWLFARVIKTAPSSKNIFFHHNWYPTACAGPYMDKVKADLIREVQRWYDHYTGSTQPKPSKPKPSYIPGTNNALLAEDGVWGRKTTAGLQDYANTPEDGVVSGQPTYVDKANPGLKAVNGWQFTDVKSKQGSMLVRWIQSNLNRYIKRGRIAYGILDEDGIFGPKTCRVLQLYLGLNLPAGDRNISDPSLTVRRLQARTNTGKLFKD